MPLRILLGFAAAGLWIAASSAQAQKGADTPTVAGWIEPVTFLDYGIVIEAKLDTGADSSSLGVTDLDRFKRNGKTWYRFTVRGEGGKTVTIEQQTTRIARIRRAEVDDTFRPVVRLKICLAGQVAETDFTLTNRSERRNAVLIGRSFLASRVLVDSGRIHIAPKCGGT